VVGFSRLHGYYSGLAMILRKGDFFYARVDFTDSVHELTEGVNTSVMDRPREANGAVSL
jgi:hypothetical protein